MSERHARNVLILGGGASGTLLAIQMLRTLGSATRITLIEKSSGLGKGFAYGAAHPIHLLNIRALNMSAYPDDPNHFLNWLDQNGIGEEQSDHNAFRFVSRITFGNYLESELLRLAALPSNKGRFTRITGEAVGIARTPDGVVVTLNNFRRLTGQVAVIATGYEIPPPSNYPCARAAWARLDPETVNQIDSVVLLGTGLSMVDHVQSLVAAGYRGSMIAISRRGLLPEVHKPVEAANIHSSDVPFGKSIAHVWRWFRARAETAEQSGSDWRAVFDGLRPHVQALWQSLNREERRRFLRHARPWWDIRRHRMAPEVAAVIRSLIDEGRLVIKAAKIISIKPRDGQDGVADIAYRRRGKTNVEVLQAQAIVDCTGFNLDVEKSDNRLVRSLIEQGLARSDPLAMGFEVSTSSALIGADGKPANDLFAVGPITRGAFWETTGIPDIRFQCAGLARTLEAV
jgi:uncharacterized NAD(P)/FAD-binding protein YdhS